MKDKVLDFWFDFASGYSYIAAMQIEAMCSAADVNLVWKPFLLGPIFALQGWNDSHFNLNPRRGAYMWRDLERLCGKFGLPFRRPAVFPHNSTLAARVASSIVDEPWAGEFIRRVFVANFGENIDIAEASVVSGILDDLGRDSQSILAMAFGERRGRLRANTERAIEPGIFGAPNCVVNGELFWGEESLQDAISWLTSPPRGRRVRKKP
jgi:2-hydroxychromene-2-carboxylate isomerase